MIYPAWKAATLQQMLGGKRLHVAMIDSDRYVPNAADAALFDIPPAAILGEPVELQNVSLDDGELRADPVVFEGIENLVPDAILLFTSDGDIVCLLQDLVWHGQKSDGRRLEFRWPHDLIFKL